MTIHRFYVPDLDRQSERGCLSEAQSRQVSRVLRLRTGHAICLFDGSGAEFDAVLVDETDRNWRCELGAERWPAREPNVALTVGLAIIRNERFDLAIQKLTELGVAAITPLAAERSVISYEGARSWENRRARIHRIVVEAAEQSERTTLPTIHAPQTVSAFLRTSTGTDTLALVERQADIHIAQAVPTGQRLALLVGPEGGWTPEEIDSIRERATPVSLGPLILRAETAAIAAASHLLLATAQSSGDRDE